MVFTLTGIGVLPVQYINSIGFMSYTIIGKYTLTPRSSLNGLSLDKWSTIAERKDILWNKIK